MTQPRESRPNPSEIAKQVESLVTQTPPEVTERMRQRLEERRRSPTRSVSSEFMTKRLG